MKKLIFLLFSVTFVFAIINLTEVKGISNPTDLLRQYEANYEQFKEVEIADKTVYYQQRKIGEAIVEKNFIVYQFDKNTGKLLARKVHWRDDLPERLPKIKITKEQAESMVEGEVQFTKLYIISPESDVFPIKPTPENPCWVVRSIDNGDMIVTIIDALEGKILGYGTPPPYTAFSLTGPTSGNPCNGGWIRHYENAETWFNTMGYSTEAVKWPTEAKIKSHVQSSQTAMFYELAHGSSTSFASGCIDGEWYEDTYVSEIETWIAGCKKMPFTFLGSCSGMCYTGDNTLSYEFRKGSTTDTVTVGYCKMSNEDCSNCWSYSVDWQDNLFKYMSYGWTVKVAFDQTQADYPMCADTNNCMRFEGDQNFKVVPVVKRDSLCHVECGADIECDEVEPGTAYCNDQCEYAVCQILLDKANAKFGSHCTLNWDSDAIVADVNKDGIVDTEDIFPIVSHKNDHDDAWCLERLNDDYDYCSSITTTIPACKRSGESCSSDSKCCSGVCSDYKGICIGGGTPGILITPEAILNDLRQLFVIIAILIAVIVVVTIFGVLKFVAKKK